MNNEKQCSKCKVWKYANDFREGRLQCNVCLDGKKRYREKHHEEIKQYKHEYYENNKEQISEYNMNYHKNIPKIECSVCKCLVGKHAVKQHEQTIVHQRKMRWLSNEDALRIRENWTNYIYERW